MTTLYFDGGSRGNPGISGAGWIILDKDNKEIDSGYCFISKNGTNNEAEYTGLVSGLEMASLLKIENLVVKGDSKLVINQVQNKWKVNAENLKPFHQKVRKLMKKFSKIEFQYIPRLQNKEADALANMGMDQQS